MRGMGWLAMMLGMVGLGGSLSAGDAAAQVAPSAIPPSADPGRASQQLRVDSQHPDQNADDVEIIQQEPGVNSYKVVKDPESGTVRIKQGGQGNHADVRQTGGTGNRVDIEQKGKGGHTQVESHGSGNSVVIRQSGGEE